MESVKEHSLKGGEMLEEMKCITCGAPLIGTNYVAFPCPVCGEKIYRCKRCRRLGNPYKCQNCGFVGP